MVIAKKNMILKMKHNCQSLFLHLSIQKFNNKKWMYLKKIGKKDAMANI